MKCMSISSILQSTWTFLLLILLAHSILIPIRQADIKETLIFIGLRQAGKWLFHCLVMLIIQLFLHYFPGT